MTLDDLRKLPPEHAMQAAARELGLPDQFFDRMWAQESGRGRKLLSPAGAEGHFQQMPATTREISRRAGKALNPNDFAEGLFMAQEVMRENLARWKDPVDATRAYNSGWKPERWNNPETNGYVAALWGNDKLPAKAPTSPVAAPQGTSLGQGSQPPSEAFLADPTGFKREFFPAFVAQNQGMVAAETGTVEAHRLAAQAQDAAEAEEQAKRDATGFGAVVSTAIQDSRVMPTWAVLERLQSDDKPDPAFDYWSRREQIEAGRSDEEVEYLRDNATSEHGLLRAQAELELRRGDDATYGRAGGFASFAGQMVAGLADPGSFVAGLGVMKGMQLARVGSGALIAAGRGGAAVASAAAEGAIGNVVVEAAADLSGEVKTPSDYMLAATAGAALTLPFARGTFRQAAEANLRKVADDIRAKAIADHTSLVEQARRDVVDPNDATAVQARVEEAVQEDLNRTATIDTNVRDEEAVIPNRVAQEIVDDAHGRTTPPVEDTPNTTPKDVAEALDPARRDTAEVIKTVANDDGSTLEMRWKLTNDAGEQTVGKFLDILKDDASLDDVQRALVRRMLEVANRKDLNVGVRFQAQRRRGVYTYTATGERAVVLPGKRDAGRGATKLRRGDELTNMSAWDKHVLIHESAHAMTHAAIEHPGNAKIVAELEELRDMLRAANGVPPAGMSNTAQFYATKDTHEFVAQVWSDVDTRAALAAIRVGNYGTGLTKFVKAVRSLLGLGEEVTALDRALQLSDRLIRAADENRMLTNGPLVGEIGAPQTSSNTAGRGRASWMPRIVAHAEAFMKANPVDPAKLRTLTRAIGTEGALGGGYSDGLKLAGSNNPVMQLVASLVLETTTGAAGRRSTAAIKRELLHRKYVGNALMHYETAYAQWAAGNGHSATSRTLNDLRQGDLRAKFNEEVYREILARRGQGPGTHNRPARAAADVLEQQFELMLNDQKRAGTLGANNLPDNSKGYVPQALNGKRLAVASERELTALKDAIAQQLPGKTGWDPEFAKTFAEFYVDRARRRSMGAKEVDGLAAGMDSAQLVHDTLDDMAQGLPPSQQHIADALAKARAGLGHTKKRLDLDLTAQTAAGNPLLDFYVQDPLLLFRQYANRTAGNVALTEKGIHGRRGISELREAAMSVAGDRRATEEELFAFDRVMSEMLGTPVAGSVVSAGATNLRLLVGLQRLGGLAFTQAAETFNMVQHLGLASTLKGIASLPKMMGEVGRIKAGQSSGNHILTSIEQWGGEIGAEQFKMVAPLDPPDARLLEYGDKAGLGSRLLSAGQHLQSKISFFRGLMAAQHRMVAEQIVMKAARLVRDGGADRALADMGLTPDLVNALRADLPHIAQWDGSGRLVAFDLSRVSDPRTAEALVQTVHRGTSQIIQGTFVGERSAWVHNDYAKLFLQLRTFGLTSVEKQWGRQRMNHGYAYASGMLLAQMALALPIHMARVQLAAAGREDRDAFIKRSLAPGAIVRSLMNYSSMSGMSGDVLEILSSTAGGWGDKKTKEFLGVGDQAVSVGRAVPIAGTVDSAFKVASGKTDLHTAVKQLPFSNIPYLIPFINLTKKD